MGTSIGDVCRVWHDRTVIGPKDTFAGVLVWAEDHDERAYAVAWVDDTPQQVRDTFTHVLDTLWVSWTDLPPITLPTVVR